MKMLKKALLLTSTLALGFTLAGCSKKNVLLEKGNIYDDYNEPYKQVKSLNTITELEVISHKRLNDRYFWAITKNKETIIYDLYLNKEVFKTSDRATVVTGTIGYNIFTITFEDGSKAIVASNGQTLVNKAKFVYLTTGEVSHTYDSKLEKFEETKFYINSVNESLEEQTKFYSLVIPGVKDENKKIVKDEDTSKYTITEINENDVKKSKIGDIFPEANDKYYRYYYTTYDNKLSFYNSGNTEIICSLDIKNIYTDYTVIILKDKALVQVARSAGDNGVNYDVIVNGSKYYLDTFIVNLKNRTIDRVLNFNYYIADSSHSTLNKGVCLYDVYEIIDGNTFTQTDIALDNNFNVIQTDQRYSYDNTEYYDLKNGYYVCNGDSKTYLCDKSGYIVKVFDGDLSFVYNSKIIGVVNNDALTFIDYKGNYITDDVYETNGDMIFLDNGSVYYCDEIPGKPHVITFENNMVKDVVDVDYEYEYTLTTNCLDINANTRYYNNGSFYFTGVQNDVDSDDSADNMTISIYNYNDEMIGDIKDITTIRAENKKNGTHLYTTSKYTEEGTYTLTIYSLDRE